MNYSSCALVIAQVWSFNHVHMNVFIPGGQGKEELQINPGQDKAYLFLITFITEDPSETDLFSSKEYTGNYMLH